MLFHVACELDYTVKVPSTLILSVHAQRSPAQTIREEQFPVEPHAKVTELLPDAAGNRFVRLEAGRYKKLAIRYSAAVDCDVQIYKAATIEPTPVAELDSSTIPYLFPSRYCQSDRLSRLAWDL